MNRRIRHARTRAIKSGFDPLFRTIGKAEERLATQFNWHINEHNRRLEDHRINTHNVQSEHLRDFFPDPLHIQWLSSTLTPFEYQHLVRRSRATYEVTAAINAPIIRTLTALLDQAEHDFLYRESAPAGAD